MIRQHFFPKNKPLKLSKKDRRSRNNAENESRNGEKTQLSQNFIVLDPEITEPLKEEQPNQRRHYSVLKPMQSVALQSRSKSKRKADEQ